MKTKKGSSIPCLCQDIELCCHVQTDSKDESPVPRIRVLEERILRHPGKCPQ